MHIHPIAPLSWLVGLGLVAVFATGCNADSGNDQVAKTPTTPASSTPASEVPASDPGPSKDGIALASPNAKAVLIASHAEAWGGPRTGKEATLSDRVVNYDIDVTLDPVLHTLAGQQKLTWRNRSQVPVQTIYVHLYLNAFEGSGSTYFTEHSSRGFNFHSDTKTKKGEWGYTQLTKVQQAGVNVPWWFVQPDGGPSTDRTVVRMDLPQAVQPGQSTVLDMAFNAKLPRVTARTGYFGSFHLVAQWFPKIAVLELPGERGATRPRWNAHEFHLHSEFYADFGAFDVRITVPQGYTVGATGEATGKPVAKASQVTHRFVQGDVHDFAFTADNRTAKPLIGQYNAPGSPPVTVTVLFPPEYEASAAPVLKASLDSLAYFSKTLGPYPYKTFTVVVPPFNAADAGGVEYPTFATVIGLKEVKPNTANEFILDFVTIHEFGHGYFYGILASNEFEEPMLDEGLNQFWNGRMLQARKQSAQLLPQWMHALGMRLPLTALEIDRAGADRSEPRDALGNNSWDRYSSFGYATAYSRTSTMLRDLEARLGTAVIEKAFQLYYDRWKFRHPSVADFQAALADASGQPALAAQAFEQQVFATRKVDDRIEKFSSTEVLPQAGTREANGVRVEDSQDAVDERNDKTRKAWKKANPEAKSGDGPFPFRTTVTLRRRGAQVPQTLVVKFADGSIETTQWDSNTAWERFSWVKNVRAVSAELDPERKHHLDLSKLDDSRTLEPDKSASRRWGSQAAALVQLVLSLVVAL